MRVGLHEECRSPLSKFQRDVLRQYIAVNIPSRILKKIRLVEKKNLFQVDGRKDGRTDMTRIVVTSRLCKSALKTETDEVAYRTRLC